MNASLPTTVIVGDPLSHTSLARDAATVLRTGAAVKLIYANGEFTLTPTESGFAFVGHSHGVACEGQHVGHVAALRSVLRATRTRAMGLTA